MEALNMVYYYHTFLGWKEYDTVVWWMVTDAPGYFRSIKTYQESRMNHAFDLEATELGYKKTRGNRGKHELDSWNDFHFSCVNTKSWKKLSKVRKQYMKKKFNNKNLVYDDEIFAFSVQ
jgi:hypothetical protein